MWDPHLLQVRVVLDAVVVVRVHGGLVVLCQCLFSNGLQHAHAVGELLRCGALCRRGSQGGVSDHGASGALRARYIACYVLGRC